MPVFAAAANAAVEKIAFHADSLKQFSWQSRTAQSVCAL